MDECRPDSSPRARRTGTGADMMPLPPPRSCGGITAFSRIHDASTSAPTPSTTAASTWPSGARPAPACPALQLFTAIPKYYGDKSSIRPERVERFRAALRRARDRARARRRARRVRAQHRHDGRGEVGPRAPPGSPRSSSARPRSASAASASIPAPPPTATASRRAERVAAAITQRARGGAGDDPAAGREHRRRGDARSASTPTRWARSSPQCPPALRARTGYGLDTCHLFAAGHDITRVAGGAHGACSTRSRRPPASRRRSSI